MSWTSPFTAVTGTVANASDWNTSGRDNLNFLYGDTTWTTPTFTNSWVNFGGTRATAGFRKFATRVVCRGAIKSGTIGLAAFTFPAGYRPTGDLNIAGNSNGGIGVLSISSAGVLTPSVGSNVEVSLDNINFDTL